MEDTKITTPGETQKIQPPQSSSQDKTSESTQSEVQQANIRSLTAEEQVKRDLDSLANQKSEEAALFIAGTIDASAKQSAEYKAALQKQSQPIAELVDKNKTNEVKSVSIARMELLKQREASNQNQQNIDKDSAAKDPDNAIESTDPLHKTENGTKLFIPDEVAKKYEQKGNTFYSNENGKKEVAFKNSGGSLKTSKDSEEVARDLVRIARASGWNTVKVRGSAQFKREVWLQAQEQGIEVKGYKPKEADYQAAKEMREKQDKKLTNEVVLERTAQYSNSAQRKRNEIRAEAQMQLAEKKMAQDNLTEEQRKVVRARIRQNVEQSMQQQKDLNPVTVRETVEQSRTAATSKKSEPKQEQELER